jgi:type VI secretion system secreted protein VgrG
VIFGDGTIAYKRLNGNNTLLYHPIDQMVSELDVIFEMAVTRQLQTSKVTLGDFDFKRPSLNMTAETNQNNREQNERQQRTLEWFDFPGHYAEPELGRRWADIRLQERLKNRETAQGRSNCSHFLPGYMFEMDCHDCDDANQQYTLVEVNHQGHQPQVLEERSSSSAGFSYVNEFTAIPAQVAYAPERKTPKPMISGVQTAIVTGPRSEAIHTDQYGRVKVRFHWDRSDSRDEEASCWIRVSQAWAGPEWGSMFIPRVGHEVIVEFEEGNPDRPIITGRVYDGARMPPYTLPDEKTKSTIKSDSVGGSGFNEIRLEDKGEEEEIFIHAQKDMNTVVENNRSHQVGSGDSLSVGGSRTVSVSENETMTIGQNRTTAIQGEENLSVSKDKKKSVTGSETIHIVNSRKKMVGADDSAEVKGSYSVKCVGKIFLNGMGDVVLTGPNIRLQADASIVLQVGGSKIIITPMDIRLSSVIVATDAQTIVSQAQTSNSISGMPVRIN